MPATVIYKSGQPDNSRPVQTSATVGSDGAITGTATFVVSSTSPYSVGQPIAPSLFSSLRGAGVQGLFVDAVSLEKRGGLTLAQVSVIGAVNPPVIHRNVEVSTRSFTKSITITSNGQTTTATADFDYQAETITVSTVVADGEAIGFDEQTPLVLSVFNNRGSVLVNNSLGGIVQIQRRIIANETRAKQNGIARVQKTFEVVLQ